MTRFGHKLNYVINTFVKHTPVNMMLHNTESLSAGDVIVEEPDQHDVI